MIVKNEENTIKRCLESVKDIVDEIIIVDTGSIDNTVEIVKEYTTKIYNYNWDNNFSNARNYAASFANGEWILVLDADEFVDRDNLLNAINDLKNTEYEIFAVKIINFSGINGEKTSQHRHVRIYKNNKQIEFFRSIHEQLRYVNGNEVKTGLSPLIIYHSGYLTNIIQQKNKNDRNKRLLEVEIKTNNEVAFDMFNLGNELRLQGNIDEALNKYVEAYKFKQSIWQDWVPYCVCNIIECLIILNRYEEALSVIHDSDNVFINAAEFDYYRGYIFLLQNRLEDAKEVFEFIINNNEKYTTTLKSDDFKNYLPYSKLGQIYEKQQNFNEAVKSFVNALNYNNYCTDSIVHLTKILCKFHTTEEVFEFVEKNIIGKKDKEFIIKLLSAYLNNNLIELSSKIVNTFLKSDLEIQNILKLKISIIQNECSNFNNDDLIRQLLYGIKLQIIDIYDLIILNHHYPNSHLKAIITSSNLKNFILFFNGREEQYSFETIETELFINLIERCIIYEKLDLIDILIDTLNRNQNLFSHDIYLKLGHLFYKFNFSEVGSAFYNEVDILDLDGEAFFNNITFMIEKNLIGEAIELGLFAIDSTIMDYRIYDILMNISFSKEIKKRIIKAALQAFPDSNSLKELRSNIG